MIILLSRKGLADLGDVMNTERPLDGWLSRLKKRVVRVFIPRFKFQSKYFLKQTLKSMGMRDAFSGGRADFSCMTGTKGLFIGRVMNLKEAIK